MGGGVYAFGQRLCLELRRAECRGGRRKGDPVLTIVGVGGFVGEDGRMG